VKIYFWLLAVGGLIPGLALAQSAEFDALLAQVPAPPLKVGAADLRWHPGHEDSGSQQGFDKNADALLSKLAGLEKNQQTQQFSYGGQSAEELQKKFATMTQQEKMAYAMQLAQKAQADQKAAYTGANAQALMKAQQNDVADVQQGLAGTKVAKAMNDLEADYQAKFNALEAKMHADAKACPVQTIGEASGPNKACVQVILAKFKKDYTALAEQEMAGYNAIFLQYQKDATAEIKGWEADIKSLQADGTETSKNTVTRKKMLIYEEIKDLTIPADKAVNLGHNTVQMDPWSVCGGDCVID